ncbi:MAG: hypothetical protein QOC83_3939 [Pseudonocardiales bacterium]|nr:hypothetical protein [Pseudonocardiales bacterium]
MEWRTATRCAGVDRRAREATFSEAPRAASTSGSALLAALDFCDGYLVLVGDPATLRGARGIIDSPIAASG